VKLRIFSLDWPGFADLVSSLDLGSSFGERSVDLRKKGFFPKKHRIYRADSRFLDASHSHSSLTVLHWHIEKKFTLNTTASASGSTIVDHMKAARKL
jgi:hypothetical protein